MELFEALVFTVYITSATSGQLYSVLSNAQQLYLHKIKKVTRSDDVLEPGLPDEIQEPLADVLVAAGEVRVAAGHPGEPPLDSILH